MMDYNMPLYAISCMAKRGAKETLDKLANTRS